MPLPQKTTRLAPSPTGALHLGNARTFLINWAIARREKMNLVLRIEDLDGPRVKPDAASAAMNDLAWLGIDWDGPPRYQRADLTPYHAALDTLRQRSLTYPCTCSRAQIRAALSAPHADQHEPRYPGTCRPTDNRRPLGTTPLDRPHAWRLIVPDESIRFTDTLHGPQTVNVQQQIGDFVVATKNALPAYQLAVVVDDHRQQITHVIRGDDLLPSTARQLWCYRLLGLQPTPTYLHLPMVLGSDGRRLAKRHGDTRIAWYREQGVHPHRVIGLIAKWTALTTDRQSMTPATFAQRLDPQRIPREPVHFTRDDHAWLLAK